MRRETRRSGEVVTQRSAKPRRAGSIPAYASMEIETVRAILGVSAGILSIAAFFPYLRDILKGTTRPSLVSWSGWTLLTGIATAAQFTKGAGWSIVVPLASTIGTALVTVLAIKRGYTKFTTTDKICFSLAGLAIILWALTREPLVALILSLVADVIVAIPTILKTYRDPSSETKSTWLLFALGAIIGAFSSADLKLHNLLFPIYLFFMDGTVFLLALRGKVKKDISGAI